MQKQRGGCSGAIALLILVFIGAVAWVVLTGKGDTDTSNSGSSQQAPIQTTEVRLAEAEIGHSASIANPLVKKFRVLLDELVSKTNTSEQDIADMTIRGQDILFKDYNKRMSLLDLMNGVNKSFPKSANMKYNEALGIYITSYVALNP